MAKLALVVCVLLASCSDGEIVCRQWDVEERILITAGGGFFKVPVKVCRKWAVRDGVDG